MNKVRERGSMRLNYEMGGLMVLGPDGGGTRGAGKGRVYEYLEGEVVR